MDNQTADISHPVRDAFQQWGHKTSVAATSAYVALPIITASTLAYAHETAQSDQICVDKSQAMIGSALGAVIAGFAGATGVAVLRNKYHWSTRKIMALGLGIAAVGVGLLYTRELLYH